MTKPAYKDLGISSKEYEEALLLERLFKLVKKNPCSTCLLKKPTHIDLDRYDLLCTTCSKRCSSKLQIGKGLISMADLERLEAIYDKSKKKGDKSSSKHKKYRGRSPSVSSSDSYDKYKKRDKHGSVHSDSTVSYRKKSKERSKKKESSRRHPTGDYYPETHDKYSSYPQPSDGYPKMYPQDRYSQHYKSYKEKSKSKSKDRPKERGRDMDPRREAPVPRDYGTTRDRERGRDIYPPLPSYGYYHQNRYGEPFADGFQSGYKYQPMTRNQTAYEYTSYNRRDVPGMMGLLASQPRGQEMVVRSPWGVPALDNKPRMNPREQKSQPLALTNGLKGFRSLPGLQKDERVSNNPFAKRNFEPPKQAYDFSHLREALNPQRTTTRYQEPFQPPRDFTSNKLGNPGFPDSNSNFFNRY